MTNSKGNSLISTIIAIAITALIVGGVNYYLFNNQIQDLKQEVKKLQPTNQETTKAEEPKNITSTAIPIGASNKPNTELETIKETNYYQLKKLDPLSNLSIILFAPTAEKDESITCMKGYFSGNFTLGLIDSNGILIHTTNLGELIVAPEAIHTNKFLSIEPAAIPFGESTDKYSTYFTMVESYFSCNNDLFSVYVTDKGNTKLTPALFSDTNSNKISAYRINDIIFELYSIIVKTYDNSKVGWSEITYHWNENSKTFETL